MLLIENIGVLATLVSNNVSLLGEIDKAAMLIDGEHIFWCGKMSEMPQVAIDLRIDAHNQLVVPGFIDCHSHLIFAGNREQEFAERMRNESYQAIMQKGGGILSTVNATLQASDEHLFELAALRADQIIAAGVTTLEAKSGYGLDMEQELRALRLLKVLNEHHMLDIHATFLGAHVVPKKYSYSRADYVTLIINEMLEQVAKEQLAIDCDVFCETGAFSLAEAKAILTRAHDLGFGLRAHVQQLGLSDGVQLLADLPLKSISHADYLADSDIDLIARSQVVVEALPIALLFLRSKCFLPIEKLSQRKIPIAVATDFNPGSAMCHDLVLAARLAVTLLGLSIEEGLLSITSHAARALGRSNIGCIKSGHLADVVITNCHSVNEFFYDWTKHPVASVIKRGKVFTKK